jgi:hypothetical protein
MPRSRSSSPERSCAKYENCNYAELYDYFKYKLVTDQSVMAAGSSAFVDAFSQLSLTVPLSYPVTLEDLHLARNVDHLYETSPFYVREDGVYVLFFVASDNQASQYSVFVNSERAQYTTIGNNAGAGQLVSRHMIILKKDDTVVIRNYQSEAGAVTQSSLIGGMNQVSDTTFLMMKIAPHPCAIEKRECEPEYKLTRHEKCMYKKLLGDMICDKDLMLRGFNIHGTFYHTGTQTIDVDAPVHFDTSLNSVGLELVDSATGVRVSEDGIYKVYFVISTNTACQFAFFVNGAPVHSTNMGTNKGAGQMTIRALVEMKKDDVLSARNYTSGAPIVINATSGGRIPGIDGILTVFKAAPLVAPMMDHARWCKTEATRCWSYNAFRQYLLKKKKLQIDGAQSYFSATTSTPQELLVGESFDFANNQVIPYRAHHQQGTTEIRIERDGIYDVFADVITNQPPQITIFVNNVPDLTTVFGRDSGGNRVFVRQFMRLRCGDVLTLRNYQSLLGKIYTATNPGGHYVGQVAMFMAFRLSPITCEKGVWPPMPQ